MSRKPSQSHLWVLHGAIHTPYVSPPWGSSGSSHPRPHFGVFPQTHRVPHIHARHSRLIPEPAVLPAVVYGASRLLQSGCFAVWLNRLWLRPWEEGCAHPVITPPHLKHGWGHIQTHPTAPCSHRKWVPQPRVPFPVWPLPKGGQPGPMPQLIQPANPPEAHVLGTRGRSGARMWHSGVGMGHPGVSMWHWRLPPSRGC